MAEHPRRQDWRRALEVLTLASNEQPTFRYLADEFFEMPPIDQIKALTNLVDAMADLAGLLLVSRREETGKTIPARLDHLGQIVNSYEAE